MNSPNTSPRAIAFAVGLLAISTFPFSGCATPPPAPPPVVAISARVPVIVPLPETKESQEKGGVEIAVVPASYATTVKKKYSVTPKSAGLGSMVGASLVTGGKSDQLIYVEEVVTPFLAVSPARLEFVVRVNNKLARVFRGQGAVVQFNVGGKLVPFGDTDYLEVLAGIVPPRNEASFVIRGPRLDTIPDKTTVGILLYDVVTQTDVTGTVTEKQNFEWFFDLSMKTVEDRAEIRRGDVFMQPDQFQRALILARQPSMDTPATSP